MADTAAQPVASRRTLAGVITASLVGVFVVVAWWPFHAPRNGVSWLVNRSGLRLRAPAALWSSAEFGKEHASLQSVAIWFEPDHKDDQGTILAFQTKSADHFSVRQSQSDLELQWLARGYSRRSLYVPGALHGDKAVLVTLVSSEGGVAVYMDGELKRIHRGFRFSASELVGRLVVGVSPFTDDCWSGQLRGLALYDRELSSLE